MTVQEDKMAEVANPTPNSPFAQTQAKPLSKEEFKAKRYRDAVDIPSLETYAKNKRLCVDGIEVAWQNTGWRTAFPYGASDIKLKQFTLSFHAQEEAIGIAEFDSFLFQDFIDLPELVEAADTQTQGTYDLALGISSAVDHLVGIKDFFFEPGMRVVVLQRLVMRPEHAGTTKWAKPLSEFIRRQFRSTGRSEHYMLVLCPFPLEYEGADTIGMLDDEKLEHRRRAMSRLYTRTLGVKLCVPEMDDKWWMGRLL